MSTGTKGLGKDKVLHAICAEMLREAEKVLESLKAFEAIWAMDARGEGIDDEDVGMAVDVRGERIDDRDVGMEQGTNMPTDVGSGSWPDCVSSYDLFRYSQVQ